MAKAKYFFFGRMNIRILLASKNQANIDLVKSALVERDVDLVLAPGMSLALFLAKKNLPVLIISDLELMDGDGLSLLREISSDSQLGTTPFIFLAAHEPSVNLRKDLLDNGASDILLNACSTDKLKSKIDGLVEWDQMHDQIQTDARKNETTE